MKHTSTLSALLASRITLICGKRLRRWLAAALLLLGLAQSWPALALNFELQIDAPLELQALLTKHLELAQLQSNPQATAFDLERELTLVKDNVAELLATQGYFSPEIQVKNDTSSSGQTRVHIRVEPGRVTRVNSLTLQFTGPITLLPGTEAQRDRAEAKARQLTQETFSQAMWDDVKTSAVTELVRERFLAAQVKSSRAAIHASQASADLSVTLDSGPEYRFGALNIRGIERYSEDIVRHLNLADPGDIYSLATLSATQDRLSASGYFDSVSVTVNRQTDTPEAAPVDVDVREARKQKVTFGLGAGTDYGRRISLEYVYRWLPGLHWQSTLKASYDKLQHNLALDLLSPPDAKARRWLVGAEKNRVTDNGYTVDTDSARVGYAQQDSRIDRSYYLLLDDSRTDNPDLYRHARLVLFNWSWHYRKLDSLQRPSQGYTFYSELGAGRGLLGDGTGQPVVRGYVRGLAMLPLVANTRLVGRGELGWVNASDALDIPQDQLFLAGGVNSVRGYAPRSIGVATPGGTIVGGRQLSVYSLEYRYPITPDWDALAFVDSGKVTNSLSLNRWKSGTGVGALWNSPLGPIEIDLAYALQDRRMRVHLNVGFVF